MKFLILTDDSQKSQKSTMLDMEANQRWVEKYRKGGELESIYSLAGNHGVAMIVNVKSPEHLDEIIISSEPCAGTSLQIHPLAEYDTAMKNLGAYFKSIAGKLKKER